MMIGTRLADDLSLSKSFKTQQEFDAWEKELTASHNKNAARYKAIMDNAEAAAQQIHKAITPHSGARQAFLEGMQYGYHVNGGWGEIRGAAQSSTSSALGVVELSGHHEDMHAWKCSLDGKVARAAGKAGFNAGSNLAKNVQSVVANKEEMVDYFTIFSLEYNALDETQSTIGDILQDLREAQKSQTLIVNPPTDFDARVREVAEKIVVFYKTHTLADYQTFLRGFNVGYTQAPGAGETSKRPGESSSSSRKQPRIESLLEDIRDSHLAPHDPFEETDVSLLGQSVGVEFYQKAAMENKELALRLLSRHYDRAMAKYGRLQRFPIYAKNNSLLRPLFASNEINLLSPVTREEFDTVFPVAQNTIDSSAYTTAFAKPDLPLQMHNRMNIFDAIFTSKYGTQSLLQNDEGVLNVVQMIMNNVAGTDVTKKLSVSPKEIGIIERNLLIRNVTAFDATYEPSSTQREMDTIRAYQFFIQSSVLLLEQSSRDVAALLFTPLLVNTMAKYVGRTLSLERILKLYPARKPLDPDIYSFLSRHVEQMNKRWLEARLNIVKKTLFSRDFTKHITDHIAADIAFYLKNKEVETKFALTVKIASRYGTFVHIPIDLDIEEYKEVVSEMGVGNYLMGSTLSLFSWMLFNNESYWPEDLCQMQTVVHDVVMLHHLREEMEQRAAMVESVLFFHEPGRFLRWDVVNFLAQREKIIDSAKENLVFSQVAQEYVRSLQESPNTDYINNDTPEIYLSPTPSSPEASSSFSLGGFSKEEVDSDSDLDSTEEYKSALKRSPIKSQRFGNFSLTPTSSWDVQKFDDSPQVISARLGTSSRSSAKLRARKRGVVLRDVSAFDNDADSHHISAHYGHAFGRKLGHATYSRKDKRITSMEVPEQNKSTVGALLTAYIGELYPDSQATIDADIDDQSTEIVLLPEELYDLVIEATINYKPNLAEHNRESPYGIFFYLSRSFSPSDPIFVSAEDAKAGKRVRFAFKSHYPEITGHAMFNVDSYAKTVDVCDDACVNQSGFASLRLADLINSGGETLKLRVPNSDLHASKGTVSLTIHSCSMPIRKTSTVRSALQLSQESIMTQKLVIQYIRANREFYKQHPNIVESVQNITVFEYASRRGVIPGSLFDSFKLAPTIERYFTQALEFVMKRRRPDADVIYETLDEHTKTYLLMDVLRLYVNYCVYIRDMVDNNTAGSRWNPSQVELIESFDYIRQRDAGDCEDFSREILQAAMELKYNLRDSTTPAIQEMRRIANEFVFASVLCGVSREAMSLGELSKGHVSLHGHECAIAMPNYIFFEALRRNSPDHPAFELYSEEEQNAGQGKQIYVLEGTGFLFPEPRVKSEFFHRIEKAFKQTTAVSTRAEDVVFYHPDREDTFYKQMITILTPELFLHTGNTSFEFLVCTKTNGALMRGVPFSLLLDIHSHTDVQIAPAPAMSPEVFRISSRMDDDNFPAISLEPGVITSEMRETCATLTTGRPRKDQDFFQFHVRFPWMTDEYIASIKQFAAQRHLQILCLAEPVKLSFSSREHVGGYTVLLF